MDDDLLDQIDDVYEFMLDKLAENREQKVKIVQQMVYQIRSQQARGGNGQIDELHREMIEEMGDDPVAVIESLIHEANQMEKQQNQMMAEQTTIDDEATVSDSDPTDNSE